MLALFAEKNLAIALRRRMAARARRRASAANRSTVKRPFQRAVRRNREGVLGRLLGLPKVVNEEKGKEVTDPSLPVVDAMMQVRHLQGPDQLIPLAQSLLERVCPRALSDRGASGARFHGPGTVRSSEIAGIDDPAF